MHTRIFGRTKAHRESMLRNLSRSLVLGESITTTESKAKEVKRTVDRWITWAKAVARVSGSQRLAGFRHLLTNVHDPLIARKLVSDIAGRSKNRVSGFVSSKRIGTRVGDAAPQLVLTLIDQTPSSLKETTVKSSRKKTIKVEA